MLDLFCGRWGWSRAFAARGWECVGVDLVEPPEIPPNCFFRPADILEFNLAREYGNLYFDFICASSPCEQFSVHGMKNFHPNPPYPELGIRLFEHTRAICEASGVPYVMENVRAAQQFIGNAVHHCGPFYLWGSGVPAVLPLIPRRLGIKGIALGSTAYRKAREGGKLELRAARNTVPMSHTSSNSQARADETARAATIPPELSHCVADYAERLLEQKVERGTL